MAETKMQETIASQQAAEGSKQGFSKMQPEAALEQLGDFQFIKDIIPEAVDMNPGKRATRQIFLTESKNKIRRKKLLNEIEGWLKILGEEKKSHQEYEKLCDDKKNDNAKLFKDNIEKALMAIKELETSYRALDLFFKNTNEENLSNLRILNVDRNEFSGGYWSELKDGVGKILHKEYDQLSLKDCYSLLVLPGARMSENGVLDKDKLNEWAKIAYNNQVMLVTDHEDVKTFKELKDQTKEYRRGEPQYQNVVITGNWIAARGAESLSDIEQEDERPGFFVPSAAALAGKLYDGEANIAQAAGGETFGTITGAKGVRLDLTKSEIGALRDNQIVPIVCSEGRVMAYNNSTLYNGTDIEKQEYQIVRVFDWVSKCLLQFFNKENLKIWDEFNSPTELRKKIGDFLSAHKGHGKLFEDVDMEDPKQDPKTKEISVKVNIKPYFAAKNFTLDLKAKEDTDPKAVWNEKKEQ